MSDNMQGKRKPTGENEHFSITFAGVSVDPQTRSFEGKPTRGNTKTSVGESGRKDVLSTQLGDDVMSIKAEDTVRNASREGEAR